jgi:sterol desaturase/sphingolipid hydroxylase (fatty acid hydroxylase superfamily)
MFDWLADGANELWAIVRSPIDPQSVFFGPYLVAFVLLALLILSIQGGTRDVWARLFPKETYLHRSTAHDVLLVVVDRLFLVLTLLPRAGLAIATASAISGGLDASLGPMQNPVLGTWPALAAFTLFEVLVADFGLFLTHLQAHRVGFLWSFHKVHHSAPVLTPVTAKRFHPLEVVEDQLMMDLASGVVIGVGHYLSGGYLHVYTGCSSM